MRSGRRFNDALRCGFSLILLIANVAAPYNTPAGRVLLRRLGRSDPTRSVARVRVLSHAGCVQGIRVVANRNPGGPRLVPNSPIPVLAKCATKSISGRSHRAPGLDIARSLRPLRC